MNALIRSTLYCPEKNMTKGAKSSLLCKSGAVVTFLLVVLFGLPQCPAGAPEYLRQPPPVHYDESLPATLSTTRPTPTPADGGSAIVTRWQQKKRTRDEVVYSAEGSDTGGGVSFLTTPSFLWRRNQGKQRKPVSSARFGSADNLNVVPRLKAVVIDNETSGRRQPAMRSRVTTTAGTPTAAVYVVDDSGRPLPVFWSTTTSTTEATPTLVPIATRVEKHSRKRTQQGATGKSKSAEVIKADHRSSSLKGDDVKQPSELEFGQSWLIEGTGSSTQSPHSTEENSMQSDIILSTTSKPIVDDVTDNVTTFTDAAASQTDAATTTAAYFTNSEPSTQPVSYVNDSKINITDIDLTSIAMMSNSSLQVLNDLKALFQIKESAIHTAGRNTNETNSDNTSPPDVRSTTSRDYTSSYDYDNKPAIVSDSRPEIVSNYTIDENVIRTTPDSQTERNLSTLSAAWNPDEKLADYSTQISATAAPAAAAAAAEREFTSLDEKKVEQNYEMNNGDLQRPSFPPFWSSPTKPHIVHASPGPINPIGPAAPLRAQSYPMWRHSAKIPSMHLDSRAITPSVSLPKPRYGGSLRYPAGVSRHPAIRNYQSNKVHGRPRPSAILDYDTETPGIEPIYRGSGMISRPYQSATFPGSGFLSSQPLLPPMTGENLPDTSPSFGMQTPYSSETLHTVVTSQSQTLTPNSYGGIEGEQTQLMGTDNGQGYSMTSLLPAVTEEVASPATEAANTDSTDNVTNSLPWYLPDNNRSSLSVTTSSPQSNDELVLSVFSLTSPSENTTTATNTSAVNPMTNSTGTMAEADVNWSFVGFNVTGIVGERDHVIERLNQTEIAIRDSNDTNSVNSEITSNSSAAAYNRIGFHGNTDSRGSQQYVLPAIVGVLETLTRKQFSWVDLMLAVSCTVAVLLAIVNLAMFIVHVTRGKRGKLTFPRTSSTSAPATLSVSSHTSTVVPPAPPLLPSHLSSNASHKSLKDTHSSGSSGYNDQMSTTTTSSPISSSNPSPPPPPSIRPMPPNNGTVASRDSRRPTYSPSTFTERKRMFSLTPVQGDDVIDFDDALRIRSLNFKRPLTDWGFTSDVGGTDSQEGDRASPPVGNAVKMAFVGERDTSIKSNGSKKSSSSGVESGNGQANTASGFYNSCNGTSDQLYNHFHHQHVYQSARLAAEAALAAQRNHIGAGGTGNQSSSLAAVAPNYDGFNYVSDRHGGLMIDVDDKATGCTTRSDFVYSKDYVEMSTKTPAIQTGSNSDTGLDDQLTNRKRREQRRTSRVGFSSRRRSGSSSHGSTSITGVNVSTFSKPWKKLFGSSTKTNVGKSDKDELQFAKQML